MSFMRTSQAAKFERPNISLTSQKEIRTLSLIPFCHEQHSQFPFLVQLIYLLNGVFKRHTTVRGVKIEDADFVPPERVETDLEGLAEILGFMVSGYFWKHLCIDCRVA